MSIAGYCRSCLLLVAAAVTLPACGVTQAAQASQPYTKEQLLQRMDPQMAAVVLLFDEIKGTPITGLNPQDARQQFSTQDAGKIAARTLGLEKAPMPVGKIDDQIQIEGPDGNKIPIRIYTPAGPGPFPVTVYFHGGGFVIATIDTYDASARALCNYSNSIIVSVEYRKAPEWQFPAAYRDALASYRWVLGNIGSYNGIYSKVAVAGESAGGNLATEVAIAARDLNLQRPTHQLLVYPVTNNDLTLPSDMLYTNTTLPLTTGALEYFFKQYLADPAEATNPDVSPIHANLEKLPPATIIGAELDPLESDGKLYAAALVNAKDAVQYRLFTGVTHEFFGLGAVDQAKVAEQYAGAALAASFK